ncbi:VOC family protein [Sphingobium sp. Sx8-8]|uniref:VOC family protein n=1 Tax=Sphingobium sp. Sx8-8 TaxID=2933617 RepID=UPI001F583649|nr:VOC family protein [Sphingobium sp. Sx8-8]
MNHPISAIDHIAITVADLDRSTGFYREILSGEQVREYELGGRVMIRQLRLGGAMLNIHQAGHANPIVAGIPTPGAADICFRWERPIADAIDLLGEKGVPIIAGPDERYGSNGVLGLSVYFRDPDENLIELLTIVQNKGEGG